MKKIILLLLVIGFHQSVFAKVLTVRRYGYGGAFWNIEQAVDSANTGDTVYIDLQGGNTSSWCSPAVINKKVILSISDTSVYFPQLMINSNTFSIYGMLLSGITFEGSEIQIENCKGDFSIEILKGNVLIKDCNISDIRVLDSNSVCRIINSKILNQVDLKSANVFFCGNAFAKGIWVNARNVVFNGNSFLDSNNVVFKIRIKTAVLIFIGNFLKATNDLNLEFVLDVREGCFSNNYICQKRGNDQKKPIFLVKSDKKFEVNNNYLKLWINSSTTYYYPNYNYCNSDSVLWFQTYQNALFSNIFDIYTEGSCGSNVPFLNPGGKRNLIFVPNLRLPNGSLVNENYLFDKNSSIELSPNFTFNLDSTLINRGHDDPAFSDLDLSRNDIGPLGGPTPITNYQQTGGPNPRIWDVTLPRRTFYPSGSISIRATGATK